MKEKTKDVIRSVLVIPALALMVCLGIWALRTSEPDIGLFNFIMAIIASVICSALIIVKTIDRRFDHLEKLLKQLFEKQKEE